MTDRDVVVVGAGPAGSLAAEGLAEAGLKVTLFEKSPTPGKDNVCAGMFTVEAAEDFRVDPAIFEKVIHKCVHFFDFATVELEQPKGFAMILRDRFDRYLAERAVSRGAELRTGTRVTDVRVIRPGLVEVHAQGTGKGPEIVRARAVVLADGPHTISTRFPGLGFERKSANLAFAFSCDVEAPGNRLERAEMYYNRRIADWGYGWIFPKKDLLNFGLVCPVPEYERDKTILRRRFEYLWHEHPRASRILAGRKLIRKRGAMIPQRLARRVVQDSVLVAGDAAGMADALLSGGIDNALQSGAWAAEVLGVALRQDRLDSTFLARYEEMWRSSPNYRVVLGAERFRDLACRIEPVLPGVSNRLKYLFALREKSKSQEQAGMRAGLRLLLSPGFRRSLQTASDRFPCEF